MGHLYAPSKGISGFRKALKTLFNLRDTRNYDNVISIIYIYIIGVTKVGLDRLAYKV